MLGFLSTIIGFIGGILGLIVDYAEQIGSFMSDIYGVATWFIGTFVIFVPQPLAVLVGLCVGVMIARFAVSRGGH